MKCFTIALLALGLAPFAHAQETIHRGDLSEVGKTDRVQLHPGDALKIRGIAQGDNDFLAKTPALRAPVTAIDSISAEEAHARRIAMYTDGKRFDSAPVRSQRMTASDPNFPDDFTVASRPVSKKLTAATEPSKETNIYLWPVMFLGLILYVGRKMTR